MKCRKPREIVLIFSGCLLVIGFILEFNEIYEKTTINRTGHVFSFYGFY